MVGYKQQFEHDPVYATADRSRLTSIWSDAEIGRPETHMTGLSFVRGGYHRIGRAVGGGAGGYTVHRPEHWLFEGTGLGYGDLLGAAATTVGYECDGCELRLVDGLPEPTGADGCPPGTVVLATAPAEPFTRANAARPVADDDLSEVEFNAWRVLGAPRPGDHPPAGARRRRAGGARGRGRHGRRHRLHRVGLGSGRRRSGRRADHAEPVRAPRRLIRVDPEPGRPNGRIQDHVWALCMACPADGRGGAAWMTG